ncbi:MAG: acyltransferase [[Clostridium] fimetarium]|nr:acyltransferase [Alistipes timonensis]MCM1405067.1 acyltransferase [[Clostridium] fimetarium]
MDNDTWASRLSATLDFARFPMIMGILVIHCYLVAGPDGDAVPAPARDVMYLGSQVLSRLCVPLFFAISGFLFFYRKDPDAPGFYPAQWRKRVSGLLVPYLLWNVLAFGWLLLKAGPLERFFPNMAGVDLSAGKFLLSFWEFSYTGEPSVPQFYEPASSPADFPLWFIRDLMVLVLLTPLIRIVSRLTRGWIVAVLCACFACGWWPSVPGFSCTGVTFFTLGAWLALVRVNPVRLLLESRQSRRVLALLAAVYAAAAVVELYNPGTFIGERAHGAGILAGVPLLTACFGSFVARGWRVAPWLGRSAFFVYAFHGLVNSTVASAVTKIARPDGSAAWILCYLAAIAALWGISEIAYLAARRLSPRLTSWLCGGRG